MDCLEILESKNIDINEKWIITAERAVLILPKALCHILNIPGWKVIYCLDFRYILILIH